MCCPWSVKIVRKVCACFCYVIFSYRKEHFFTQLNLWASYSAQRCVYNILQSAGHLPLSISLSCKNVPAVGKSRTLWIPPTQAKEDWRLWETEGELILWTLLWSWDSRKRGLIKEPQDFIIRELNYWALFYCLVFSLYETLMKLTFSIISTTKKHFILLTHTSRFPLSLNYWS